MSAAGGNDALLARALADLHEAWRHTEDGWRDAAREHFQQQYLDPLDGHARQGVKAAAQLEALLAQALRQCQ